MILYRSIRGLITILLFLCICSDNVNCVEDLFLSFEKVNLLMRIDESRLPTAFKCATVSKDELPLLRKVKNIIRRGRIESLEKDKIIFKDKR